MQLIVTTTGALQTSKTILLSFQFELKQLQLILTQILKIKCKTCFFSNVPFTNCTLLVPSTPPLKDLAEREREGERMREQKINLKRKLQILKGR